MEIIDAVINDSRSPTPKLTPARVMAPSKLPPKSSKELAITPGSFLQTRYSPELSSVG